jgi:addiction module RelB/DinJ family antitoxin
MATTKIRSNVYLDKELKEKAKEIFKEYGLSLSDGINMLLNKVVKNKELIVPKELDIEPVYENDPDYEIIKKAREHRKKHPEDYVDFNDIDWD